MNESGHGTPHTSAASRPAPEHAADTARPALPRLLDSAALLAGEKSVDIHHQGAIYRLQATRQGKLILTK